MVNLHWKILFIHLKKETLKSTKIQQNLYICLLIDLHTLKPQIWSSLNKNQIHILFCLDWWAAPNSNGPMHSNTILYYKLQFTMYKSSLQVPLSLFIVSAPCSPFVSGRPLALMRWICTLGICNPSKQRSTKGEKLHCQHSNFLDLR